MMRASFASHVDQICSAESARWIVLKTWLARYGFRKNPSGCARRARSLVSGSAKPDRKIAGIWNRSRSWRANSIPSIGPTNRMSISANSGCRSSASDNAVAAEPTVPTTSKPESLSSSSSELTRRTSSSTIRRRADLVSGGNHRMRPSGKFPCGFNQCADYGDSDRLTLTQCYQDGMARSCLPALAVLWPAACLSRGYRQAKVVNEVLTVSPVLSQTSYGGPSIAPGI